MTATMTALAGDPSRYKLTGTVPSISSSGIGAVVRNLLPEVRESLEASPPRMAEASMEERLFDALAAAKVWTSRVAMHMKLDERNRYFRQLDLMHDIDEWHGQDSPVQLSSYQGFVRFMLTLAAESKPSLGLSPNGALVAAWQNGQDRLTVEFTDRDHVEWVVSRMEAGEVERVAGRTHTNRLLANLSPYHPEAWFGA